MRTYVLSRLSRPALTGGRFKVTKKFDLEEHLRGSLGVYKGRMTMRSWWILMCVGRMTFGAAMASEPEVGSAAGRDAAVTMRLNNIEEAEKW